MAVVQFVMIAELPAVVPNTIRSKFCRLNLMRIFLMRLFF